jgi:hypothetical protein
MVYALYGSVVRDGETERVIYMPHSCSAMPSRVKKTKRGPGATHRGGGCGGHGEIQSIDESMTKDKRNHWNKPAHLSSFE